MKLRLIFLSIFFFTAGPLAAQDNDDKENFRSITLNIDGADVEVQALLLDSGKVSLFKVFDYYLKVPINSQFVTVKLIKEDNEYKNQLRELLKDCPTIDRLIPKTKFNNKSLANIVKLYNSCSTLTRQEFYSPTFSANFGIGSSFSYGSIKSSSGYTENLDWSFKPAANFYLKGAIIPPRKKNIAFAIEAAYSHRTIEGYSWEEKDWNYVHETYVTVKYHQLTTALRFIHYIKSQKRVQPFYSFAFGRVFTGNAKTELWNIDSSGSIYIADQNPSKINTQDCNYFAFLIGARAPLKTKYTLEFDVRFDIQPDQIQGDGISESMTYSITPTIRIGIP